MIIYLNGHLLPQDQAPIDPTDRGLTLGDGLFETILAQDGAPLRIKAHLDRLHKGTKILNIPLLQTDETLGDALRETLKANGLSDGVLRLTLTRGSAPRGLTPPQDPCPTLLITAQAKTDAPVKSLDLIIATVTRRNQHSPLSQVKSLNRLDDVLARMEAKTQGADDALLLNTSGRLAESTTANLFAMIEEHLITPPLSEGALPGIMRAHVMEQKTVVERPLTPEDLNTASEIFVTNALGIYPVTSVDGKLISPDPK